MAIDHPALRIITGPMYSSKSTKLWEELIKATHVGFQCLYINHELDVRTSDGVSTHNPLFMTEGTKKSGIIMVTARSLSDPAVLDVISRVQIIAVDEAQFFDDLEVVLQWVNSLDSPKHVFVAGLNSDYLRKPFGNIQNLICQADSIEILTAYCSKCATHGKATKAIHTYRTSADSKIIIVGAKDHYIPVCRICYNLLVCSRE